MTPLRIAVAGLGTVGSSVVSLLQKQAELIEQRTGRPVKITAVSARSRANHNVLDLEGVDWVEHAPDLAMRDDVDVVCELIGGSEGIARELCEATLTQGKSLVTANKALLATHGLALAKLAEEKGCALFYEAAVAGGIPIIKTMRESMAGNKVSSVQGILNGTSNYILDRMTTEGLEFESVLADAQDLGYAEADPSADVDGFDAAHKLALMASIAYGVAPNMDAISIEGIGNITKSDIQITDDLGYVIKHLGVAVPRAGGIEQRVSPCLLPKGSRLASVNGVLNAVQIQGDFVGELSLIGPGAGGKATASAVVSDVIDLARGLNGAVFGAPASSLGAVGRLSEEECSSARYIRVQIADNAGVLDEIQAVLRQMSISIESATQSGHQTGSAVMAVILTQKVSDASIKAAIEKISQLEAVIDTPLCLRIENEPGED